MLQLKQEQNLAWIEWNQPQSKVNVLSEKSLSKFSQMVDQVIQSKTIKVACIISKKPSVFIAGADLKEIQKLKTKEDFEEKIQKAHQIFEKMNNSSVHFIASIGGTCLGGGTELALACDYRIASDDKHTQIGLPEVNLGFIPGFGGCVRLPRLIPWIKALDFILTGKSISARKAHRLGIIDQLASPLELETQTRKLAETLMQKNKNTKTNIKTKPFMAWLMECFFVRILIVWMSRRNILKKPKVFIQLL